MREIKVDEILTRGDVGRDGRIDVIVVEVNGGKVLETAKERRERAGKVGVGEVKGSDGASGRVTRNATPVAWGWVTRVP